MEYALCILQVAWCLVPGGSPVCAHADRIRLKDGRILQGVVTERKVASSGVEMTTLDLGAGLITIPAAQIDAVIPATPAEQKLMAARDLLQAGRSDEAMLRLNEALAADATAEDLALFLAPLGDRLVQAAERLIPAAREALSRTLAAAAAAALPAPDDFLATRLELHLALGERPQAEAIFDQLGPAYFAQHPERRDKLTSRLLARITGAIEAGQNDTALALLGDLHRVDPALAAARQTQFHMQMALKLRREHRWEEAIEIYVRHLLAPTPMIARDRIAVALREAEAYWEEAGQLPQAAALYERYGLPYIPEVARARLMELWRKEGWRLLRAEQFAEARAAFAQIDRLEPGRGRRELRNVEFFERRKAIAPQDWQAFFDLGVWCEANGLTTEAIDMFSIARRSPKVGDAAAYYLEHLRAQEAEKKLLRLMDLYDAGRYVDVLNGIFEFRQEQYGPEFVKQAGEIETLTREALRIRRTEPNQQAEALLQNAQRDFYQGRYDQADKALTILMRQYKDSIIYPRAFAFYKEVADKLALARLERGGPLGDDRAATLPLLGAPPPAAVVAHEASPPTRAPEETARSVAALRAEDATTTRGEINRLIDALSQMDRDRP